MYDTGKIPGDHGAFALVAGGKASCTLVKHIFNLLTLSMVLVFLFEDIIKAFGPLDPTVVHSAANAAGIKGANAPQSTETIGSRRRKDTSHIKVTRILQRFGYYLSVW